MHSKLSFELKYLVLTFISCDWETSCAIELIVVMIKRMELIKCAVHIDLKNKITCVDYIQL